MFTSKFLWHQEAAASAEQCSKMITRQPVVKDVTLVARSAEDQLQSGSADVQSF